MATIAAIVVTAVALTGLPQLTIDNRLEHWVDPGDESAARYRAFQESFGQDEYAIIAYSGADVFSVPALDVQLAVLDAIETLPMTVRVMSVATVYRDNFGAEDAGVLRDEFLNTPFYRGFLIAPDGAMAAYLVVVDAGHDPSARSQLAAQLTEAAEPLRAYGFEVYLGGSPIVNAVMDDVAAREARRVFPAAIGLASVMLVLLFRSIRAAAATVIIATLSTGAAVGVMGLAGVAVNLMTSVLPALLWTLSLANAIHIVRRFQQDASTARSEAAATALRTNALPCTLSSLTTAVGFASLLAAPLAPVQEFGLFAAIGLLFSLALSLTLLPWLLAVFRIPGRRTSESMWLPRLFKTAPKYPRLAVIVCVLIAGAALAAVPRINTDSNPLTFFDSDAPIVRAYNQIGESLTGLYSLELVLELPGAWFDPEVNERLAAVESALASAPGVTRVVSPLDLLRKANQWDNDFDPSEYRLPSSAETGEDLLTELGASERSFLDQYVLADGNSIRLSVLAHTMQNRGLLDIVERSEAQIAGLPAGYAGYVTGVVPHLVQSQERLSAAQMRSFAIAFGVVFVCLVIGLRSPALALLAVPVNLMPIAITLGVMAIGGIALNVATVMTASVALGIAVDDTVHLLVAFRRRRIGGMPIADAWQQTVSRVGPAIFITTLTACGAFWILGFSEFVPIRHFGLLAALAIAAALAADLLFLPALALTAGSWRRAK
jgi:uncharacterized protein